MQRDTRDSGYIPGLERSLGAGNGMNLSKLWEIAKDREVWHAAVHGVTKSETQCSNGTSYLWIILVSK